MKINRRQMLLGGGACAAGLANSGFAQTASRPLPIIPMIDLIDGIDARIGLSLNSATHDLGKFGDLCCREKAL